MNWCSVSGQRCCQALVALQLYCKFGGAHAKKTKQWMHGNLAASDSVEMGSPICSNPGKDFYEQIKRSVVF